ncbi:hypothetical protein OH492_19060 [Vibrio chagasii]|nr:hypothetical protein [Vibrio chagasii]
MDSNTESIREAYMNDITVLSVDKTNYQLNDELTYTIKVSNTDTVIKAIDVQDAISLSRCSILKEAWSKPLLTTLTQPPRSKVAKVIQAPLPNQGTYQ